MKIMQTDKSNKTNSLKSYILNTNTTDKILESEEISSPEEATKIGFEMARAVAKKLKLDIQFDD